MTRARDNLSRVIDISDSVAKKTVQFGRAIKGSELVEAVRAACEDERSFVQQRRYDDGDIYLAGRTSGYPGENVLVTPTKTDAYMRADDSYESAVVVSHDLGGGSRYAVREDPDASIKAVIEFAGRLEQQVAAGPQEQSGRGRDPYAPAAGAVNKRPDSAAASPRYNNLSRGHEQLGY